MPFPVYAIHDIHIAQGLSNKRERERETLLQYPITNFSHRPFLKKCSSGIIKPPPSLTPSIPLLLLQNIPRAPVASSTLPTSPAISGIARPISAASTSRKSAKPAILPFMSWFPRRASSTNSRV